MEEEIAQLVALAGNKNRYQYFIAFLCFLFWVNLTVLAFSLGFLENKPLISYYDAEKNETTVESMEYDHCDWDKSNYTIVETYKFSWVINLGLECEKLKVSLIGTFTSIGALLGAIFYSSFTKRFGEKKVILVSTAIFMLTFLIAIFVNYYAYYVVTVCLCMIMCNMVEYSTFVIISELVDKSQKSIISSCINAALGIGGIFYVLMFMAFKNWKHVFIVCIVFLAVLEVLTFFFMLDSLENYISHKDYDGFMKALRFIAKFNGRLDLFNKEIATEGYQNILKCIQGGGNLPLPLATPRTDILTTPAQNIMNDNVNTPGLGPIDEREEKLDEEKNKDKINRKDEVISSKDVVLNEIKKVDSIKAQIESPKIELQQIQQLRTPSTVPQQLSNEKKKETKKENVNVLSLFKYPSVRYTFILFCILWFCTSACYNGLTIGLKTLPGNIYINSLLLFIAETPGYFVGGVVMNTKVLGRKYSLMIFTGGFSLMCLMLVILFNYNTPTIVFYLLTRFCVMSSFCIYYTYCLESYPLSINHLAYGLNGACNSLGGIIIPFIVEYIERRTLYLIYCIFGAVCVVLMIFLKETNGKPIPDQIKEIEETEKGKDNNDNIPVVVV